MFLSLSYREGLAQWKKKRKIPGGSGMGTKEIVCDCDTSVNQAICDICMDQALEDQL